MPRKGAERFQFLRAQLQGFGAFASGDVGIHFQNTNGAALGVAVKNPEAVYHHTGAFAREVNEFAFPDATFFESALNHVEWSGKQGLQKVVGDAALGFLAGKIVELFEAGAPKHNAVLHVTDQDRGECKETGLLAELLVGAIAFGDVAKDHRENTLTVDLRLGNGGFDGEFFSVGTQTVDGRHGAHLAASGVGLREGINVRFVRVAKPIRNQLCEIATQNRSGSAAEHTFGGGIEEGDALLFVGGDDGVHSGADDRGQASFVFLERLLKAAVFGAVAGELSEAAAWPWSSRIAVMSTSAQKREPSLRIRQPCSSKWPTDLAISRARCGSFSAMASGE